MKCVLLFMAVSFFFVLWFSAQGDMAGDCVYATCCNICSWCQMAREIKRRKQNMNVITAQPVYPGGQQYLVTTQSGVMASQPMVTATLM